MGSEGSSAGPPSTLAGPLPLSGPAPSGSASLTTRTELPWYAHNLALDGVGVLVAIVVVAVLVFVALALRRRSLLRGDGTIDASLRRGASVGTGTALGRGWVLGVARYDGDVLKWFRVFSFSARPAVIVSRRELSVRGRREPVGPEAFAVNAGAVVVEVAVAGRRLELAMSEDALTGFLSWLEAAPPGAHLDHIN